MPLRNRPPRTLARAGRARVCVWAADPRVSTGPCSPAVAGRTPFEAGRGCFCSAPGTSQPPVLSPGPWGPSSSSGCVLGEVTEARAGPESGSASAFQSSAAHTAQRPVLDRRTSKLHGKGQGEELGPPMPSAGFARRERWTERRQFGSTRGETGVFMGSGPFLYNRWEGKRARGCEKFAG